MFITLNRKTLEPPLPNMTAASIVPMVSTNMTRQQIRKDASGNVHVDLDSSTPCWNDAIEWTLLEVTDVPPPRIYKGAIKLWRDIFAKLLHRSPRFLTVQLAR
jgi:hypothetical protein